MHASIPVRASHIPFQGLSRLSGTVTGSILNYKLPDLEENSEENLNHQEQKTATTVTQLSQYHQDRCTPLSLQPNWQKYGRRESHIQKDEPSFRDEHYFTYHQLRIFCWIQLPSE